MNLHVSLLFLSMILNLSENALSGKINERKNFNAKLTPELHKELSPIIKRRSKRFTNLFDQDVNRLEQCAIMYKNQEPIGILQPYKDSYRLLPVNGEQIPVEINQMPVKQPLMNVLYPSQVDSDYSDEHVNKRQYQVSQYSDDRYPYIFAKFKIDSKIDKTFDHSNSGQDSNSRSMHKRELKQPYRSIKELNPEAVDEEIKNILTDMGLLDDEDGSIKYDEKREVEDENLETGTNKISLVQLKPLKSDNLSKREDSESSDDLGSNEEQEKGKPDSHSKLKNEKEEYNLPVDLYNKHFHADDTDSNVVYAEDSSVVSDDLRGKREKSSTMETTIKENDENREKRENSEGLRTEEKKNHLNEVKDSSTSDVEPCVKESTDNMKKIDQPKCEEGDFACKEKNSAVKHKREDENADSPTLNQANDMTEYEKQLLTQISNEINNIKEQVKREVTTEVKQFSDNDDSVKTQRKKRYAVNTLLDEETNAIDPLLNKDEKLVPHLRRRRHVANENILPTEHPLSLITTMSPVLTGLKGRIGKTKFKLNLKRKHRKTGNLETQNYLNSRSKRFIGVNPILNRVSATSYYERYSTTPYSETGNVSTVNIMNYREPSISHSLRKLKQYDEDYTFLKNKQPTPENSDLVDVLRNKRETTNDEEYDDESANSYENEPAELSDKKKAKCGCGKNGNGCKCGSNEEKRDTEEDSGNSNEPAELTDEKKAKCGCGKNGNGCKCGSNEEKRDIEEDSGNSDDSVYDYTDDSSIIEDAVDDNDDSEKISTDVKRDTENDKNVNQHASDLSKYQSKSLFQNGEYYLDLYPAVYKIAPVRSEVQASEEEKHREKREDFKDLVSLHGGPTVLKHLAAVRRRSMVPLPRSRIRRKTQTTSNNPEEQQQLINMSDEDLFGALPQSYEGELARYKRVKRSKRKS